MRERMLSVTTVYKHLHELTYVSVTGRRTTVSQPEFLSRIIPPASSLHLSASVGLQFRTVVAVNSLPASVPGNDLDNNDAARTRQATTMTRDCNILPFCCKKACRSLSLSLLVGFWGAARGERRCIYMVQGVPH